MELWMVQLDTDRLDIQWYVWIGRYRDSASFSCSASVPTTCRN